jgi:hypothetical protein
MPVIAPFWLSYPDPAPVHPEPLLGVGVGAGVLPAVEVEPPHPARTKIWSANANEQRKERKSRNMRYTRYACEMRPARLILSQIDNNVRLAQVLCPYSRGPQGKNAG